MYEPLVILHSWLRWVVLLIALVVIARALSGKATSRPWTPVDDAAAKWFLISMDVQVLIGLVLYLFLSPYTMSAWSNMAGTMRDRDARFWAVEHAVGMIGAAALAHIGKVRIRKAADSRRRHTLALIFFVLALLLIIAVIPWPFMQTARPLIRGM